MVDGWKKLALVVLGMAAGCAPVRPAGPEAGGSERGVEVANHTGERVDVHYYIQGSSVPRYLGSVGSGGRDRLALPEGRVTHVYASTGDGRRISRRSPVVQIRLVRL